MIMYVFYFNRKLRHTIEEFSARVGQQAIVLCCTPTVSHSVQVFKVFGSQPLENVVRENGLYRTI